MKDLLWTYYNRSICILVPKKYGSGYLKVPYGHHQDKGLEDVRDIIGGYDLFGLDGYIEVVCDKGWHEDEDRSFSKFIMDVFEKHYGCNSREILFDEFNTHIEFQIK